MAQPKLLQENSAKKTVHLNMSQRSSKKISVAKTPIKIQTNPYIPSRNLRTFTAQSIQQKALIDSQNQLQQKETDIFTNSAPKPPEVRVLKNDGNLLKYKQIQVMNRKAYL